MFRRKKLVAVFGGGGLLLLLTVLFATIDLEMDRKTKLELLELSIRQRASRIACKHPHLPLHSPELDKFLEHVPPLDCSGAEPEWVTVKGSKCIPTKYSRNKYGSIKCHYTDIIREDDFSFSDGKTTLSDSGYTLVASDVVRVKCQAANGQKWRAVLTGIRKNAHQGFTPFDNDLGLKMNVLMLGLDSMSRNAYIRKLPKTYEYLVKGLKAHVLEGYNIVGDGTPQALIPILTGQTELELPEARKRISENNPVNVFPFIWKEFSQNGYATAFLEDLPQQGIFTYRFTGFKEQPTDHYMRTFYLAASQEWKNSKNYCYGTIPRHNLMLDNILNFFSVYESKPKFLFGFHGELSHDSYNLVEAADEDLQTFLARLKAIGALNNTLLIFMADHGHRFADVRNTVQGKQEERLPFFSFVLPDWFAEKYPRLYENFLANKNRLTTPFDIYSTLKTVLDRRYAELETSLARSISLFNQVPAGRSCSDAHIEPHWCTCLEWESATGDKNMSQRIADFVAEFINSLTATYRRKCALLSVESIEWLAKWAPNTDLLKFRKNADVDGFVADMSGSTVIATDLYQIRVMLRPSRGLFEATVSHDVKANKFTLKEQDISRTNVYKDQAGCVTDGMPDLRKYCFCNTDGAL